MLPPCAILLDRFRSASAGFSKESLAYIRVLRRTLPMLIGKKLRDIREAEGLTREELAEITGIPVPTMKRYETGRIANVGSDTLTKFTQHPRFSKYALWLMTNQVVPESGQISPSLSPDGYTSTCSPQKIQKAG